MEKLFIIYGKNGGTVVINDKGKERIINRTLMEYLDYLSLCYGSSLEGRFEAFEYYTGVNRRKGIIISNSQKIYIIATKNLKSKNVVLINYNHVKSYHKYDAYKTLLVFDNGLEYIINTYYRIIKRQMKNMYKYIVSYREERLKVL